MSNAISGPGFIIGVATSALGPFTTMEEVKAISGPEQVVATVDVTNQSSPNNYREWIPTLIDGGSVTFPVNYNPSNTEQNAALTTLKARTLTYFQLTIGTTGEALHWAGYFVKFGGTWPVDNVAAIDVEIKITGPVTGPEAVI
jgi:hypothetical protein